MLKAFKHHPEEVGETYVEHLGQASSFGGAMILGGIVCLIHGVFPFLFKKNGSRVITELHDRMVTCRSKAARRERSEAARRERAEAAGGITELA